MRIVYVMDPMTKVLPDKDTTFAFQRASQARGHQSLHAEVRDVFVRDGDVYARVRPVTVSNDAPYFAFGAPEVVRLADVDAVAIRKDPPFDREYLYLTLLLERVRNRTVLLNDPRGLRDANEKLYATHFAHLMPRTMVSANEADILAFAKEELGGKAVIKPLDGAGGAGVLLLDLADKNARAIVTLTTGEGTRYAMVQEFLPSVTEGDKRVLLMGGKLLGAINRIPRGDDHRSNIHVGGRVEPTTLTAREQAIVDAVVPRLLADGLIFVGLDVIGERLTEVNVTSPTGIQELSQHLGRDVAEDVIAWIERAAEDLTPSRSSRPELR